MASKREDSAREQVLRALRKEIKRLDRQYSILSKSDHDIFDRTIDTFESVEGAAVWLAHEQRFAGDKTPAELAQTQKGKEEVFAHLNRIEHGVYF